MLFSRSTALPAVLARIHGIIRRRCHVAGRIHHSTGRLSKVRAFAFLSAVWLLLALGLSAQTPDAATIQGHITDQSEAAVPGVRIKVTNTLTGLERTAETEASGSFSFPGLPIAGNYHVTAVKQGFAQPNVNDITLSGGTTANVDIRLNVAKAQEEVTVTGVVGEVRTDQPQLGDRLSAQQMEETPLLNRKITNLPLLNAANHPAINQGDVYLSQNLFTTNGSGRRQTSFVIDGVTANDSWGRQTLFTNIPLAAVQEMTILENAFSAEYGASTGGVVSMVTKTGGDRFHGELLELWRPRRPKPGSPASRPAMPPAARNSPTILSANRRCLSPARSAMTASRISSWPLNISREDRASPVTSPIAPGEFVGHYREWPVLFRLDHRWNDKDYLFFRSAVDGFHDTNPNGVVGGNSLPSVDRVYRRRTYAEELGDTAVLSARVAE